MKGVLCVYVMFSMACSIDQKEYKIIIFLQRILSQMKMITEWRF